MMATPNGFLALDKPPRITSRAAVDRAQLWFAGLKLGHAGTLDPFATGLLVIAVGHRATRLLEYVQDQEKVYRAAFTLGSVSSTDDPTGEISPVAVDHSPDKEAVESALRSLVGTYLQSPPAFSAVKIAGRRAYRLARQGKPVQPAPRLITVHKISLLRYAYPVLELEITCGKGTYIRSLARDLGEKLRTGAYVSALRRLRIGKFELGQALSLVDDDLWPLGPDGTQVVPNETTLLPLSHAVAHLPACTVSEDQSRRLQHGQPVPWEGSELPPAETALFDERDVLLGVGRTDSARKLLIPIKIIAREE